MTAEELTIIVALYLLGLVVLRRLKHALLGYLWSAFGLAAVLILMGQYGAWHDPLGAIQASTLATLSGWLGLPLETLGRATLVVPDSSGWSVLSIGIECSTLIEASVFAGILLFYPRFSPRERLLRLTAGLGATILINMARLAVIVGMVATFGKSAVPLAHAVVGRLVFFLGIVVVYWRMLTMPTLKIVRRDLEVSGRAVK
jgi:exosortase family protein XrtG